MHFPEELSDQVATAPAMAAMRCSARSATPCASPRWQARQRRLAGRAHADRRHREPAGRDPLHRRGLPVGLRQDQPGHADPAGELSRGGLEGVDGGRRHLLDAPRRRRPPVRDQSGGGLLRRRARHHRTSPIPTRWPRSSATPSSPTSRSPPTTSPGGKAWTTARRRRTGRAATTIRPTARPRIPTRASPCRPGSARATRRVPKIRRACRSRRSSSAAVAPRWCRWCSRPATGPMACWSARAWVRKPPRPRPARSA